MRSIFAIVFSLTFPFLLSLMGLSLTLMSYAAISIIGAIYLWRALPETKGKSLEEIGEYWRDREARRTTLPAESNAGEHSPPAGRAA